MPTDAQSSGTDVLLRVVGLTKRYRQGGMFARNRSQIKALKRIDLQIRAGATLALIGRSGSGKSTLARCLASIEEPDEGDIWFCGKNLGALCRREEPTIRRQVQLVFQEPGLSLNPRFTASEIVSEPLLIAGQGKKQRRERALELMELVGLPADSAKRLPFEFSGGQRRRLAIARALALQPRILILDESLAGLDLSIQAQISNLLMDLQRVFSLTYICISHDLDLVAHLADDIAVIDRGEIAETASTAELLASPRSVEAKRLLAASLELNCTVGAP